MPQENADFRSRVLLSVQRALLDEIMPEMRAVTVEFDQQQIKVWVAHHGDVDPRSVEEFDAIAMTQIAADFWHSREGGPTVDFEFVRIDRPEDVKLPGTYVFALKESYIYLQEEQNAS